MEVSFLWHLMPKKKSVSLFSRMISVVQKKKRKSKDERKNCQYYENRVKFFFVCVCLHECNGIAFNVPWHRLALSENAKWLLNATITRVIQLFIVYLWTFLYYSLLLCFRFPAEWRYFPSIRMSFRVLVLCWLFVCTLKVKVKAHIQWTKQRIPFRFTAVDVNSSIFGFVLLRICLVFFFVVFVFGCNRNGQA